MKVKLAFLAGGAAGYVLGTREGRQRYEQIKNKAEHLWNDPTVQEKVGQAKHHAKQMAEDIVESATDTPEVSNNSRTVGG